MKVLTSEYLRNRLTASGVDIAAVAKEADLVARTLYRIAAGENSPRLDTAERLLAALDKLYPQRRRAQAKAA